MQKILIVFILLTSLILKIWYIDWGLPNLYNHDEINHIEEALQVGSGKLEPEGLKHGTLIAYLLFLEYGFLYILGKVTGNYLSVNDFVLSYATDPTMVFVVGRVTIVLLSVGSIFFTYLAGKKLFNERIGIISAIFIAFSPIHFIHSTFVKDDIPATFFCALFFYFISLYFLHDNSSLKKKDRFYSISGFVLGLAIAAKLTAIPGIITFCLAFILKETTEAKGYRKYQLVDRRFLKGIIFVFAGFFIADPYAVIKYKKFIYGILSLKNEYTTTTMVTTVRFPQIFYFTDHLPNMIGIPLTIFLLISVIYFVFKPSNKLILLLSFPISYYLLFNDVVGYAYHILTALPFIVILCSVLLDKIISMIKNKYNAIPSKALMVTLIILLIAPEVLNTVRYIYVLGSEDTRTLSKRWIEDNIPLNSSILIEGAVMNMIYMSPQLKGNLNTLKDDFDYVKSHRGRGGLQKLLIDNFNSSEITYRLYKASVAIIPEYIDEYNADYIITSGFLDLDIGELKDRRDKKYYMQRDAVYKEISNRYELIKQFEPFPYFREYFPLFISKDFDELRKIKLFSQQKEIIPGPEIKIFKRKI